MQYMHIWTHTTIFVVHFFHIYVIHAGPLLHLSYTFFAGHKLSAVQIFYAGDQLHGDPTFHANHLFHMSQKCVMDHV